MLEKSKVKVYRYDCEIDVRNPYYAGFYVIIEEFECKLSGKEYKGKKQWNAILRHEGIGFTEEMFGMFESDYCKDLAEFVDIVEGNLINQDYFESYIKNCKLDELFCEFKEEFLEWLDEDSCGCPVCGKGE